MNTSKNFNLAQTTKLFSFHNFLNKDSLLEAEKNNTIPKRKVINGHKVWTSNDLPEIGKVFGYLPRLKTKQVITSFVTKGGVLKTSITLNLARTLALHNYKVCVVGLDIQGDITNTLGFENNIHHDSSLEEALLAIKQMSGLYQIQKDGSLPKDLLLKTDLKNLSYLPETPELVHLDQQLLYANRRELWLKNNVITPLLEDFDFIILDCPPNWNNLITNALVATDVLISPLECKINNFRNLNMFEVFMKEFKKDLSLDYKHLYIPTRYSKQKKLSQDILSWYQANLSNVSKSSISENLQGEEASAMKLSLPEYLPSHKNSLEIKELCFEVAGLLNAQELSTTPNKEINL